MTPLNETELAEMVRAAAGPILVQGNGTKTTMLRPVQASETLSTAQMTGITLYAPNELIMSARAGTKLSEIEAVLAEHGQQMIAEPSHLFGPDQTIGGITGANISGPRRITGGAMRDHVLGVRAVNGEGEILNFGGRVLKNVTGLDVAKLLTGSFGTLAVMTDITFKVLPVSEATGTILVHGLDADAGVKIMSDALGSPFSVSGAAYLPAEQTAAIRIEDFETSVSYRCEKLSSQFGGRTEILGTAASKTLWEDIRDCKMLPETPGLWRVSVAPSKGAAVLRAFENLGVTGFLDWGGGLVWLAGPAEQAIHESICAVARAAGGVWWLMRAPDSLRAVVDVVPPDPPAMAAMRRRVQHSFDPRGIFNPLKLQAA